MSIIYGIQKFQNYFLGRHFTLRTDYRPLVNIFDATRISVSSRTSSCLTRWGLQLSQYKYDIEYRSSSSHANVDALSRHPFGHDKTFDQFSRQDVEADQFVANLETQNVKNGPIVYKQLQNYVRKDAVLREIIRYIKEGWSAKLLNASVKPYSSSKHQLLVIDGCLLKHGDKTTRVVLPSAIRQWLLLQLHRAHVGSACMRKLARRYIWWSSIDCDIDKVIRNCDACTLHRNILPTVSLHP